MLIGPESRLYASIIDQGAEVGEHAHMGVVAPAKLQKTSKNRSSRGIRRRSPIPLLVALKTALLPGADENGHFQSDVNDPCESYNPGGCKAQQSRFALSLSAHGPITALDQAQWLLIMHTSLIFTEDALIHSREAVLECTP